MMKTKTTYIFIISGVLFVMSICLFLYTRGEVLSKVDIVKEFYQKEKKNSSLDFEKIIKKDFEQIIAEELVIKKTFLDENRVVDFIAKIELAGKNLDVFVRDIKHGDAENIENSYLLSPILFNIQVKGSFSQIEQFIKEILQSEEIITVDELRLYKGSDGVLPIYTAHITIKGTTISYE